MEEIKPKKERKFLKAMGEVALTLVRELLLNTGKKLINKSGNKRQGLVLAFIILASTFAIAQYPTTTNKQRLGFQTSGDGLVFRGRASDTTALKPSTINNAYHLFDTLNNVLFSYIKTKGGWKFNNSDTVIINNNFTQPVDSLFFNVGVPTNNVDTAKMRWDSDLATVVLGLNDNVPNELGFKNFWLVKNQTGATITKGSLVYANGTVGASGRITVAKFIANGSIDAKYLLGITAHDLTNGEDGYVISFGKIRQVNTDTFSAGAILYPSPTVAGVWTDVEPVAPNIDMPIGFCINSSSNNGTIAIRVASGYKLSELHDVSITSPVESSSLYYKGGMWRDTTPTLLVSDTASMLTNYLRSGVAANTYLPLAGGTITGTINRQEGSNDGSASTFYYNLLNYFAKRDNNKGNQTAQITFTDRPGTSTFPNNVRTSDIYLMTAKNFSGGQLGQYLDTTLSVVANQDGGRIGISKLNPSYKLDVNGTLGVSGPSTFLDLQGTGSRMVIAGSGGLLSTQAIPTGTVTSVGGTGTVNGISLSGTVTSSGNLTLGGTLSGVSLSSQVTGTLPIGNGGTGATTAATARTALGATVRGANTFILPDLGAISFLRYNADNTVSQRAADGMRTDLGGTTIGQSMFTLTNPSAITFPRFNADNTVSALDAATFRTAIGAGTSNSNGTVTSVSINPTNPNGLTVATGTTTPVISMALAASGTTGVVSNATQQFSGAKTFLGDINGSSALNITGLSALNGGATIGTMATTSTLTHVIGVNSSNAIGEIGVGDGIKFTGGSLGLDLYKVIALLDVPITGPQTSSDTPFTVTGAALGQPVILGVPNVASSANTNYTAWVSAANTVTIRFNNYSSSSVNPPSGSFTIVVLNL